MQKSGRRLVPAPQSSANVQIHRPDARHYSDSLSSSKPVKYPPVVYVQMSPRLVLQSDTAHWAGSGLPARSATPKGEILLLDGVFHVHDLHCHSADIVVVLVSDGHKLRYQTLMQLCCGFRVVMHIQKC